MYINFIESLLNSYQIGPFDLAITEISAFKKMDRQTDKLKLTFLLILTKNIYIYIYFVGSALNLYQKWFLYLQ